MPSVKFNKHQLLELLGKKISDEQLLDRINYLGANCESVSETEVEIEIFPNRPDLLSEQGLARALRTFLDIKPGFKKYDVKKSSVKVIIDKSVKNIRPYTACAIVKNLRLDDEKIKSIIQVQEKLHITYGRNRKKAAIGVYPLEHIKPPIYYKALRPEEIHFKPLDMNKDLSGSQILAIHPTGREYAHLLEGKEKYPIFIDSKQQIMSMPPIINSNSVGKITTTTHDVFVECSGSEFEYLSSCINIIVSTLADMGGQIYSVDLKYPDKKYTTPMLGGREVKLDVEYVNKRLGLKLSEPDIKKCLAKMGHDYKSKKAIVPGYRADILHPIDLVEDIAIAYGYENFTGSISEFFTVAKERPMAIFENKLRDVLVGLGLIEVKNFHLTSKLCQLKLMNHDTELVELKNSLSQDYDALRSWIIPNLLETLRSNKHHDYPQNIFEIGSTFHLDKDYYTGVRESERLAIALCGSDANFTRIKQVLDSLTDALGIKYELTDTDHGSFIKGRSARVIINGSKTAFIGEIHPQVLMNWGIEMPISAIELNLVELFGIIYPAMQSESPKSHDDAKTKERTGNKPSVTQHHKAQEHAAKKKHR